MPNEISYYIHFLIFIEMNMRHAILEAFALIKRSEFVHHVIETFVTRILMIVIGLLTSVVVTRLLGPEGRGLFAVATTISAIGVQFGNLGLHASNTYYVARDRSALPALTGNTLFTSFLMGGMGAAIAYAIFSAWPNISPIKGLLLVISLIWIPFGLAYALLQNLLLGINKVRAYNKIDLVSKTLTLAAIIALAIQGTVSPESVLSVSLILLVATFAWCLWHLWTEFREFPTPSLPLFLTSFQYGFKAYLAAFLSAMIFRIDVLMINHMIGEEQTGYYSVATGLCNLLYILPVVVGTILFPKLSSSDDQASRWSLTFKTACVVGAVMLFASVMLVLLGKYVIIFLYGNKFRASYLPFVIMLPGVLVWSVESIFRKFLNTDPEKGFRIEIVYIWSIVIPMNIVLNFILIPRIGTVGAAIASTASFLTVAALVLIFSFREARRLELVSSTK